MQALKATSERLQRNDQKCAHLVPFAGPQCFAHIDPDGSSYRVDANMLRRSEKRGVLDDSSILNAFHTDRWKQCCVCAKWRFVDEDTARLLRSESFFEERDSDLDWARWLREVWLGLLLHSKGGVS